MKKTMKMIVSFVLVVMFLALLGCRNETVTPKPETTPDTNMTQDANASQIPTETEQPTQTAQLLHAVKPGQPHFASLKYRSSYADTFTTEDKEHYLPLLDEHDLNAIRTFLEIKDKDGVRNGFKMNEWYSPDDPTTWFYSPVSNEYRVLREDYRGYVDLLTWNNGHLIGINIEPFIQKCYAYVVGFVGELDLSNCKELKYVSLKGNDIQAVNLEGCEELDEVYIADAQGLKTLNITDTCIYHLRLVDAPNLETILPSPIECVVFSAQRCDLKQIDWICSLILAGDFGEEFFHAKLSAEGAGSIETYCDDKYTYYYLGAYAVPDEGHRFIGWYDEEGKLVTTDQYLPINDCDNGAWAVDVEEYVAKFE